MDHSSRRVRQCPLPFETSTGKGAEGLRGVVGLDGEALGGARKEQWTCLGLGGAGQSGRQSSEPGRKRSDFRRLSCAATVGDMLNGSLFGHGLYGDAKRCGNGGDGELRSLEDCGWCEQAQSGAALKCPSLILRGLGSPATYLLQRRGK